MSKRRTFGTTRELPSGRFQARYNLDGQRIALEQTFPSRKLAEKALSDVQADIERGRHVSPQQSKGTLAQFGAAYMATKTDWAATTRQDRESLWERCVLPALGSVALKDITTTRVRAWHATLHRDRPSSAQGAYRLLRQVLNAAVDEGRLVANPCRVKGAGVDRAPERQVASVAEVEAMVDQMPERLRLAVLLATYAGLRRSEVLGLRRQDVDVLHRTVTVSQTVHHLRTGEVVTQGPKTAAGGRSVAFPSSIVEDVAEHLGRYVEPGRDALVFTGDKGGPLRPHVLGAAFRRARALVGRPDLSFHDLRHTHNTLVAATGATLPELMYRMGHATPHSALRYLHATKDRDRALGEALAPLRPSAAVVELGERRSS